MPDFGDPWFKKLGEPCFKEGNSYFPYPVLQTRVASVPAEHQIMGKDAWSQTPLTSSRLFRPTLWKQPYVLVTSYRLCLDNWVALRIALSLTACELFWWRQVSAAGKECGGWAGRLLPFIMKSSVLFEFVFFTWVHVTLRKSPGKSLQFSVSLSKGEENSFSLTFPEIYVEMLKMYLIGQIDCSPELSDRNAVENFLVTT